MQHMDLVMLMILMDSVPLILKKTLSVKIFYIMY